MPATHTIERTVSCRVSVLRVLEERAQEPHLEEDARAFLEASIKAAERAIELDLAKILEG